MARGMNWTPEQLAAYKARSAKPEPHEADEGPEDTLQTRCEDFLKAHGFPYFHDRSRRKNKAGFPDLVIALPKGRTVWVELKSKDGRLSEDQKTFRNMLSMLGHEWHLVRSFRQFVKMVEENHGNDSNG